MARDDAEWRRIVAGAGVEEIAQRAPRSPDEAERVLAGVADLDRDGRSALRLFAEVLVAAARGQTGRELRNVVRAADRRRGPVADGPSSSSRSAGEPVMPTGRRLAQAAVAIVLAMVGPVLLYSRPRRPGWIAPVEDVAVWAGILSVLGALWLTFVEPRRAGRPWLSAGLYMVLAVVTAIGLAILVGRTVMGETLDPVPRGVVFTGSSRRSSSTWWASCGTGGGNARRVTRIERRRPSNATASTSG